MRGLDLFTACQVCDCARQFHASRAMISTRGQIQLTHRRSHQTLTFILQLAKLPYLPNTNIRIGKDGMSGIEFRESCTLNIARGLYARSNRFG